MTNKIYINGKLLLEQNACVSIFDRSYLYGEGAFETMRAYNGRPAFCDMHYHRLRSNCEKLQIELPLSENAFEHAIVKTLNSNKLKEAFIRVTVSAVGINSGLARPKNMSTNFVIFTRALKERPKAIYQRGASVVLVKSVFGDDPDVAEIKSTNYLTKMLARLEVTKAKADEGIFQNRSGLILEGTASNIFVIKKGRIFTPPLADGCLPGITRWVVMGLAEELGIECVESSIRTVDLKNVDEIFLTGSTTEITPVYEVRGFFKKTTVPGPVTKQLMATYRELISKIGTK